MKPVTVQCGGRVGWRDRRQASVMDEVPLGLMRRMLIFLVDDPVTEESVGKDISAANSPVELMYTNLRLSCVTRTDEINEQEKRGKCGSYYKQYEK